jgi:hypothetical protein
MTTNKILDKLAKLKAAAVGEAAIGNQAAADAFAQMINTLLLRHELSEADIPLAQQRVDDPIIEDIFKPREHGLKFVRNRVGWQEILASIVAQAHLCKILVHPGCNYVTFVGTKSHVAIAEHAFGVLAGAADRMSVQARDDYWRQHRNDPDFQSGNYRAAWLRGFISRISERFDEVRRREVADAPIGASTALVRLNQTLVRVDQYLKDKKTSKASAVRIGSGSMQGVRDGRRAADNMKIGQRAVNAGSSSKLIGG